MHLVDEAGEPGIAGSRRAGQRMIGSDRHERGAENGVRAGGVDVELGLAGRRGGRIERPADQQALRAADPVLLHDAHLLGPAAEPVKVVEQRLGHRRDAEEPLSQVPLLDRRAGAPAAPVDDLLVGKHGHVDRVPIDLGRLAFDQAGPPEIEEHLLLVLVVARIAGGELAGPVERQAHRLQLALHRGDVGIGPVARIDLVVPRRVLGGQAEGVPAHRMQHVEARGAAEAGDHVAHRVVAHVPHMDASRGVGKHLKHIIFRPRIVVAGGKQPGLFPGLLPLGLGDARIVTFGCHAVADVAK